MQFLLLINYNFIVLNLTTSVIMFCRARYLHMLCAPWLQCNYTHIDYQLVAGSYFTRIAGKLRKISLSYSHSKINVLRFIPFNLLIKLAWFMSQNALSYKKCKHLMHEVHQASNLIDYLFLPE
jgi:hypothetical protein